MYFISVESSVLLPNKARASLCPQSQTLGSSLQFSSRVQRFLHLTIENKDKYLAYYVFSFPTE